MYRLLYLFFIIVIPIIFGWWLFIPMAIFLVYLVKFPYEIIFVAIILDSFYYFGENIITRHQLTIFSLVAIIFAIFLDRKIHWHKLI